MIVIGGKDECPNSSVDTCHHSSVKLEQCLLVSAFTQIVCFFVEPKASVVIIAEDATRIDSKTTTLGLSSTGSCASDTDMMKSASTVTSTRSSARRRVKSAPREVILFRNGAFISKEPIAKQQSSTTLCFETTTNNNCPQAPPPLHQQQITATGLQAAAQIVACNVLRQATLNGNSNGAVDLTLTLLLCRCTDRTIDQTWTSEYGRWFSHLLLFKSLDGIIVMQYGSSSDGWVREQLFHDVENSRLQYHCTVAFDNVE